MVTAEEMLCEQVHRFDEQSLTEVYDRYSPEIYRYAARLLGELDLAEECVAETFSRFLLALKNGGGPRQFLRAYLYRIAHNWVTDYYRRRLFCSLPLDAALRAGSQEDPPLAVAEEMERHEIRLALAKLTPDQRQVIVLRYLEEWEYQDISYALDKPVGAVKALQHRALNSLRRLLIWQEVEALG